MTDAFSNFPKPINAPAERGEAIAPSDTADLPNASRGLFVGAGGTVVGILAGDTAPLTFPNLASGSTYPLRFKRVLATGTTATSLIALW